MDKHEQAVAAAKFGGYKPPATPIVRQEREVPSEEKLRKFIENGFEDMAQELIDSFALPYTIKDKQLLDNLKGTDLWLRKFITIDPETDELKSDIMTLSKYNHEVLIHGETGTGKELLSRALIGNRTGKSLAVNCAGLPEHLVESELFGYKRGAFTGAESDRQGLMASASDGLLFLDEIGELPLQAQAKLLRALQDKKIRRVGSMLEEEISCRFVFATNRDISKLVIDGKFRQDLYARISTFEYQVKPLRDRKCDIEPICNALANGKDFYQKYYNELHNGGLSLEHNVRSIQQHHTRWSVFGKVIRK